MKDEVNKYKKMKDVVENKKGRQKILLINKKKKRKDKEVKIQRMKDVIDNNKKEENER